MRFKPYGKYQFQDTDRKRACVVRKHKKQAEAFPLFAEEIQESQPSIDDVMTARAEQWDKSQKNGRSQRAKEWLRARAKLNQLGAEDRKAVLDFWNNHRWFPGTPVYLFSVLHMFSDGRYIRVGNEIVQAKVSIDPSEAVL